MRHPFIRTLAGQKDPYFKNTTLLLHGDGTNGGQNNTFVDGSTNNFTITRNGNTTQGTFSPYGDNWSNFFDGTGDSLTCASNAAFAIGTGQFTIEFWIQFNSLSNIQEFIRTALSDINYSFVFYYTTSNFTLNIGPYAGVGGGGISVSWTPNGGQWYHLAASRDSSNTQRLFIDGVLVGSSTSTVSYIQSGFGIFQRFANFNGYFSNLRFVNGTAIYTSNFTVPTAPLTAVPNTVLLTCQSNRFRDASTNNFTLTRNGNVSVQRFSPFSPTAAYAAGTIGGSGYFDGTGDYLQVADNAALEVGASDFTVECWAYLNALPASNGASVFAQKGGTSASNFEFNFRIFNNAGTIVLQLASSSDGVNVVNLNSSGVSIVAGTWYHFAVTKSGTDATLWINGASAGTSSSIPSTIYSGAGALYSGANNANANLLNGYISNLRLVKGTAVYTAAFTPPTAPLTAITNTSLLLNFQNAAILDNAMMAVPETVGNAQIDTTTKKFGTGSLEFDGAGDYLVVNSTTDLYAFGSGAFTIEFWLYLNSTQTSNLIDFRPSGTEGAYPTIFVHSNVLKYYTSTGDRIIGSTLSNSVWYHIALCKSGTSTKLFIDGTQTGSTYTDTATYLGSAGRPYIGGSSRNVNTNIVNGYIDDLRITKGVARYTANFIPPTAPFPDF